MLKYFLGTLFWGARTVQTVPKHFRVRHWLVEVHMKLRIIDRILKKNLLPENDQKRAKYMFFEVNEKLVIKFL